MSDIPDDLYDQILDEMTERSGMIVFHVTLKWANQGRLGEREDVVVAADAIEAVTTAWESDDRRDLREVQVEWLCPVESVKKADHDDSALTD